MVIKRSLIVEDSPTMRKLIKFCLKNISKECVEAADGLEAIEFLSRDFFDLILTDINMPDMNGIEFIANLRRNPRYAKVPIIVISTEGSEGAKQEALAAGANGYIAKPFQPPQLEQTIQQVLKRE